MIYKSKSKQVQGSIVVVVFVVVVVVVVFEERNDHVSCVHTILLCCAWERKDLDGQIQ